MKEIRQVWEYASLCMEIAADGSKVAAWRAMRPVKEVVVVDTSLSV